MTTNPDQPNTELGGTTSAPKKSNVRFIIIGIVIVLLALGTFGAYRGFVKNKESQTRIAEMKIIGIMLANHPEFPTSLPNSFEEFEPLLNEYTKEDMRKIFFGRDDYDPSSGIRDGKYVILWGAKPDLQLGTSQICIGYEKRAESAEGMVLFADTSTKFVTAEEFKALQFAK